ncbi:MAG: heme-binding protein [Crocinitomicaceae bacterium]|nr:heme-binding protein [Crocinitomicaceae bacterium]MDG1658592.1 heme-binding protein [Crocinitomicaceae bacterium]
MRYILLIAFILVALITISQVLVSKTSSETNSIKYETLATRDGFQIRKYPELTVASTELSSSSYSRNSSSGFRKIASYIFGGNSSEQQIAMTSPVQMEMGTDPTMSFFMPGDMDPKEYPTPNRKDVTIHVQPSKIVAVIEFSGWASDKVLKQKFKILKSKLTKDSIEFKDSYSFLGYDPPYQLINRKNELIIELTHYEN